MNTLLISYDLGSPETSSDYKLLIDRIKLYETWAKPLESFWLIRSSKNCSTIRDELKVLIDSNDKLLVMDVTDVDWASWQIDKDVVAWMKANP